MASQAAAGRKGAPPVLKLIEGKGLGRDGRERDRNGRPIEPTPTFKREAPPKPAEMSPDAEDLWDRVVEQMMTIGLLKPLDAAALEAMCETFARYREAVRFRREHGQLAKNSQGTVVAPWIKVEEQASKDFRAWCSEFGITPAAERHLIAQGEEQAASDNPY